MNNIMDKITKTLDKYLVPVANWMANNRYFASVRDALVATMPLTIVGSIALLIATLPFPQAYVDFMANNPDLQNIIYIPFNLTVSIISVYVSFGIGYHLSNKYNLNPLVGGSSALLTFLIMAGGLDSAYLGAEGMFTAIIAGVISTEVNHFCVKKNVAIKLPEAVPANISGGFSALIPCFLSTLLVIVLIYVVGFDINAILSTVLTPIITAAGNSIVTALLYVVLATLMWFAGLHPSILASILSPAWIMMETANAAAFAAGEAVQYIFCKPFYFTFIFIGGQCGTLALTLVMLRSKSKTYRDLSRIALPCGLFNINEPILFGMPIVMNPILIVPALIGQVITTFTTWAAFGLGFVPPMINPLAAVWNLPSPIAAFVATVSWQAVALVFVNMIIQGIIYMPFYRLVERDMVAKELAEPVEA